MDLLWGRCFRLSMFAERVDATIGEYQSLDGVAAYDVGFDDLVNVGQRYMPVPYSVGIHHQIGPMLALIETSRLVGANTVLESTLCEFLFERPLQLAFSSRIAAPAGSFRRALVATDKDVLLELGHFSNLQEKRCRAIYDSHSPEPG